MAGTAPYEGGCNPLFDFDWALGQLAWLDWFGAVIEMYSTQYMLAEDKALAYMLFNVKNRYFLNPTKL